MLKNGKKSLERKKWYAYGTSITSEAQGKYVQYVKEFSGMEVKNFGFPGGAITDLGKHPKGQIYDCVTSLTDGKQEADLITLEVVPNEEGELGDKFDNTRSTFCGCLNQCIRFLQENTNAQIVVLCSVPTKIEPSEQRSYYERAIAVEEVCKINRVYCLNSQNGLGYARIKNNDKYTIDNIHQTDLGGYNYAKYIWSNLKNIPLWFTEIPE